MRVDNGLGGVKEDNPINRGGYFLNQGSQIGVDDLGKDLSLLHSVVGSGSADEKACRIGFDVDHGTSVNQPGAAAWVTVAAYKAV